MTKVSVIVPAFRSTHTITAAIESLYMQTYQNWEAIIVSDDRCNYKDVLGNLNDKRICFASTAKVGSGPSNSRNVGFRQTTGEFVTTLDADDIYFPTRLEKLLDLAKTYGAATDNVFVRHDNGGHNVLRTSKANGYNLIDLAEYLRLDSPISFLFSKSLVRHKWLNSVRFGEDILFHSQLFNNVKRIPMLNEPLRQYNVTENSITNKLGSRHTANKTYSFILEHFEHIVSLEDPELRLTLFLSLKRRIDTNLEYLSILEEVPHMSFQEFVQRNRPLWV